MAPAPQRRLIVAADDFGIDRTVNLAVETGHAEGVLTSASLVTCGEAFEDAVAVARRNPRLGIGIHLTLNGERPLLARERIPSIVGNDGMLLEDHAAMCRGIVTGSVSLAHIADECEAQIAKFFDAGLVPTHVDSHRHVHLFPPVLKALGPVLKRFGIRRMRRLRIPLHDYSSDVLKACITIALGIGCAAALREYSCPDYYVGFFRSGRMELPYAMRALARLPAGVTEIGFHPGTDNAVMAGRYRCWAERYGWGCDWEREYRILKDRDLKDCIAERGIELIRYDEI